MKSWLAIIGMCIAACVLYGIAHDLAATHVCLAYFTSFYPLPAELAESKVVLGLILGIASTWWLGLFLGLLIAACARLGRLPKMRWKQLLIPLGTMIVAAVVFSTVFGVAGYLLAQHGVLKLEYPITDLIPSGEEPGFWAVGFMNLAAYATAILGGIVVLIWIRVCRHRAVAQ